MDIAFLYEHPFLSALGLLLFFHIYKQAVAAGKSEPCRKGLIDAEKSKSYYYDNKDPVVGADADSFIVLASELAKDKQNIYYCEDEITYLVDYESFRLVSDFIIADKNKVFVHQRWLYTDYSEHATTHRRSNDSN